MGVITNLIMASNRVFVDGRTIKDRYKAPTYDNFEFPKKADEELEIDFYDKETGLLDLKQIRR